MYNYHVKNKNICNYRQHLKKIYVYLLYLCSYSSVQVNICSNLIYEYTSIFVRNVIFIVVVVFVVSGEDIQL